MQWIAEAASLSQASSQCGRLVQWWMTAELKVPSPVTFIAAVLYYTSFILHILESFNIIPFCFFSNAHMSLKDHLR